MDYLPVFACVSLASVLFVNIKEIEMVIVKVPTVVIDWTVSVVVDHPCRPVMPLWEMVSPNAVHMIVLVLHAITVVLPAANFQINSCRKFPK